MGLRIVIDNDFSAQFIRVLITLKVLEYYRFFGQLGGLYVVQVAAY
jgi:hypothetical protein